MNNQIRVQVNLRNPGEFLACCGLLEVAYRVTGGFGSPAGSFDEREFVLAGTSISTQDLIGHAASNEVPDGHDSLAPLILASLKLRLDWWRQPGGRKEPWTKTPFKLWAGQQSSANIWKTLREAVAQQLKVQDFGLDRLFGARTPLTSRFGFDPGAAWNALDVGFSPNDQQYGVASSPLIELLAAIGIQRIRPASVEGEPDTFEYAAWATPLPAHVIAAAASGCLHDPKTRCFRFRIASRGSYGCFTTATQIKEKP